MKHRRVAAGAPGQPAPARRQKEGGEAYDDDEDACGRTAGALDQGTEPVSDNAGLVGERLRRRGGQIEPEGRIGKALRALQDRAREEGAPPFSDNVDVLLCAQRDEIRLLHYALKTGRLRLELRMFELDRLGLTAGSLLIGRLQLLDTLIDRLQSRLQLRLEPGGMHGNGTELPAQIGEGDVVDALGLEPTLHAFQRRPPGIDACLFLRKGLRRQCRRSIRLARPLGTGCRARFRLRSTLLSEGD